MESLTHKGIYMNKLSKLTISAIQADSNCHMSSVTRH